MIKKIPRLYGFAQGNEANPDKIQAILDMKPPQNVKEV